MNENNGELFTPKGMKPKLPRTSTVNKDKTQRRDESTSNLESSLGLLSLNDIDISDIVHVSTASGNVDQALQQQRQLANDTLYRASRVSGIPSRLLKADIQSSKSETDFNYPCESTVNESDLLQTPKNTSTPRRLQSSKSEGDFDFPRESTVNESDLIQTPKNTSTPRPSSSEVELLGLGLSKPRESIFSRLRNMLDTDISTHNAVEEFRQIVQANKTTNSSATSDGGLFLPAEEAAHKLMADELSWKNKHEIPAAQDFNSVQEIKDMPSVSIGEFFQQGSDNFSVFRSKSPSNKLKPVALIDSSKTYLEDEAARSLSISAIQQILSEAEDTPTKVIDYLLKQNRKMSSQQSTSDVFSLPVSRDASYTSSFSDNEAIRVAASEDKENVKPFSGNRNVTEVVTVHSVPQIDNKSLSPSSRSSSSLSSLPNGKLPIESTVGELVWGCVKADRSVTKQFMLRNKTPKILRLQCSVSTHEFKIRKDNRSESDYLSACRFVLHGHESRPLVISFIPTKIGPAIDELVFVPLDANLTQTKKQCVRLWGYGGYSSNEYQSASRDNTGKYWLSLGRMNNRVQMDQTFTIKNVGNLSSFTYIKIVPKHIVTFTNLRVEPGLFVLLPNEEKTVSVKYIPNTKDCRILKQNLNVLPVVDIGKLEIVSGPEASRARLRRLHRKRMENGLTIDSLTKILSEKINGELFPSDMSRFKENPNVNSELLETLNHEEMVITIEQDPNQTLVAEYPEDSIIYQTLCQNTVISEETEQLSKSCRLEPPSVVLFPPAKSEDCLFLTSESTKTLHYEVNSNPEGLRIAPTDGALAPGETAQFNIKLSKSSSESYFKVLVYVENDVFESEVKVLHNNKSLSGRFLE